MRDRLVVRLRELDVQRAEVLQRLDELGAEDEATVAVERMPSRRATPSLAGAYPLGWRLGVRWACCTTGR